MTVKHYYRSDTDPVIELDDGRVFIMGGDKWKSAPKTLLDRPSTDLMRRDWVVRYCSPAALAALEKMEGA